MQGYKKIIDNLDIREDDPVFMLLKMTLEMMEEVADLKKIISSLSEKQEMCERHLSCAPTKKEIQEMFSGVDISISDGSISFSQDDLAKIASMIKEYMTDGS